MTRIPYMSFENSCNGNNCKIEINLNPQGSANKSNTSSEQDQAVERNGFARVGTLIRQEENGAIRNDETLNNGDEYESESESDTDIIGYKNNLVKHLGVHNKGLEAKRSYVLSMHNKKRKYDIGHLGVKKQKRFKQVDKGKEMFPKDFEIQNIFEQILSLYPVGSYFEREKPDATVNMENERNRFNSFYSYTGFGDYMLLAQCGFYHDQSIGPFFTRCFKCGTEYSEWSRDDEVLSVHRRMSPNCPFLLEIEQNGDKERTVRKQPITLLSSTSSAVSEAQRDAFINLANSDLTPGRGNQELPADEGRPQPREQTSASITSSGLQQISATSASAGGPGQGPGIGRVTDHSNTVVVNNPKHPDCRTIDTRISSYQGWPDYLDQTPSQMSEAGFFFVGVADFTRCFCCGGGLRNWEPGDDPMIEHTRWFPRCEYVNKLKGERYVNAVQRRHQKHMASQQQQQIERAQRRDETRNPPDPMTTDAAATLQEMGYSAERTREAILAVRRLTGSPEVSTQQVLTWLLDDEERRLNANTETSTETSLASAGSVTSTVNTTPITTTQVQGTGSSTAELGVTTSEARDRETEAKQTASSTAEARQTGVLSNSSASYGSGGADKQSGDSDESKSAAPEETRNPPDPMTTDAAATLQQMGFSAERTREAILAVRRLTGSPEVYTKQVLNWLLDDDEQSSSANTVNGCVMQAADTLLSETVPSGCARVCKGSRTVPFDDIREQNRRIKETLTCKICFVQPASVTFLPCRHLACCKTCDVPLQSCPLCKVAITGRLKTYMS